MIDTKQGFPKILLATDFSSSADAALQQAVWAAKEFGARLVLTHVVSNLPAAIFAAPIEARQEFFYGDPQVFQRSIRQRSNERLKEIVSGLHLANLDIGYETLVGEPFVKIIQAVQEDQYDLVVVGTRGLSPWKRFLLGSTAKRLVRKCPSSVWVVKPHSTSPPKSILVATDLSEVSRRAVEQAIWIAKKAQSQLHILHVIEGEEFLDMLPDTASTKTLRKEIQTQAEAGLEEFLHSMSCPATGLSSHLAWGVPWREINRHAELFASDLIVIGTVGRSGVKGLLLGNTADKVLSLCDCSILAVKPVDFVSPIEPPILPLHEDSAPNEEQRET